MSTQPRAARSGEERRAEAIDRAIGWLEDVLYVVIAVVLALCAAALVVSLARGIPDLFRSGGQAPVLEALDAVLLVFIVVELLFAVRATVARRELVAEPFLVVGIIASIKEIVVISVKAADAAGKGDVFRDEVTLVGGARRADPAAGRRRVPAAPQGARARRGPRGRRRRLREHRRAEQRAALGLTGQVTDRRCRGRCGSTR